MKLLSIFLILLFAVASTTAQRSLHDRKKKGKNDKKHLAVLEGMCSVLQVFDNVVRFNQDTNVPGIPWDEACDEFDPVDDLLCPSRKVAKDICDHPNPEYNPSVKHNYCEPLFALMEDEGRKASCTTACVNYVSVHRGGCCDFYCA